MDEQQSPGDGPEGLDLPGIFAGPWDGFSQSPGEELFKKESQQSSTPKQAKAPGSSLRRSVPCRREARNNAAAAASAVAVEADTGPYICCECGESFLEKQLFTTHQKSHSEGGTYPPVQPRGSSFRQKPNPSPPQLAQPLSRPKPPKRPGPEKSFDQKPNAVKPPVNHMVERPYNCSQCKESFKLEVSLLLHQKLHTGKGEGPLTCTYCGKDFRDLSKAVRHQRIHTGERPYQCTECGKSFIRRDHLLKHWRVHTGETPYQCATCGKNFRYKESLNCHQKIHSRNPPPTGVGTQTGLVIKKEKQ
uniref:C2H2-type domain-containing protein n=1 Tax=Sphenodon punctatus TaxID=8508 RepID=A0A8D0H2A5_SPHPU